MGNDKKCKCGKGAFTRRTFLKSAGIGSAAVVAGRGLLSARAEGAEVMKSGELVRVSLMINRRRHTMLVEPRQSLLYVLRERLGLTGTKIGCERGECGACTVLMDNVPRYACMTLAVEAQESEITTLEGLMSGEELGPVQQAFAESDAFQCGYCTPGQIMTVEGLLRASPDPSVEEVREALSGNLCRCGAYPNIIRAAKRAAALKQGGG